MSAALTPEETADFQQKAVQPAIAREQSTQRIGPSEPEDQFDPSRIYEVASKADRLSPLNRLRFAKQVYIDRFPGLVQPGDSIEGMTYKVHGAAKTIEQAVQWISDLYKPFEAWGSAEQEATANQITGLEKLFSRSERNALKFAAVQPSDKAADILRKTFSPEMYEPALSLIGHYAGTTGGTFIENTSELIRRAVHRSWQSQIAATTFVDPSSTSGLFHTVRNDFPDNKLPDGSPIFTEDGGFASGKAKDAVALSVEQAIIARDIWRHRGQGDADVPPTDPSAEVKSIMDNFAAKATASKTAFEQEKLNYHLQQAQPVIKSTGSRLGDYTASLLSMLPDLGEGSLAGVGTGGAGSVYYFAKEIQGDVQQHLIYDEGLTQRQAATVAVPVGFLAALPMAVRADTLLKPLVKREVLEGFSKTFLEMLPQKWMQKTASGGIRLGTSWAQATALTEAQDIVQEAGVKVAKLYNPNLDDPGWKRVAENVVPNAANMLGLTAITHTIGAVNPFRRGNPMDHVNLEVGDPGRMAEQERALVQARGREPSSTETTPSAIDEHLMNLRRVPPLDIADILRTDHGYSPKAAEEIKAQLEKMDKTVPQQVEEANERIAIAQKENELLRQTELDAIAKRPVVVLEQGAASGKSPTGNPGTDILDIVSSARAPQTKFLTERNMTWEEARALSKEGQTALQKDYTDWLSKQSQEAQNAVRQPSADAVGTHVEGDKGAGGTVEGEGMGQGEQGKALASPVEEGVKAVEEAVAPRVGKAAARAQAVVDAAYALLRGGNPKVSESVGVDATRLFNKLHEETGLSGTELMQRIREEEVKQFYGDKLNKVVADIHLKGRLAGEPKLAGAMETGKAVLRDMLGPEATPADEKLGTITKLVQAAVRGGRKQAPPAVKAVPSDALDILETKQKSKSKESRLALYDALHQQAQEALRLLHEGTPESTEAVKGIINDMFGGVQGKKIRVAFRTEGQTYNLRGMMEAINNEIEARAKGIFADNLVKAFKGVNKLTGPQRENLAALAESAAPAVNKEAAAAGAEEGNFQFHLHQLEQGVEQSGKRAMLQDLLDKAQITPEEFDKRIKALEGGKGGILQYFKNEAYGNVKTLHDKLLDIIASSRKELFENEARKVESAKAAAPIIASEVGASTTAKYGPAKGEKIWQHANEGAGDLVNRLGGLFNKFGSVTRRILHTDVFNGWDRAKLESSRLTKALDDAAKTAGFSSVDIARYKTDFRPVKFADRTVSLSTGQMMEALAAAERESTKFEMSRALEVRGRHENPYPGRGWRAAESEEPGDDAAEASVESDFLTAIRRELTPQQQAFAHEAVRIINDHSLRESVSTANEYHTGLPLTMADEVYYPRRRGTTRDNPNEHLEGGSLKDISSFTKPTQSNKRPLVLSDIFSTTRNYVEQAALYAHVSPATDAARRILALPEMQDVMNRTASPEAVKRLHDAYSDNEGQSVQPDSGYIMKWLKRGQTLYALWGNITGAMDVRAYATTLAATKLAIDHGARAAADFLAHSILSIGPKKLLGWELHPQDIADLDRLKEISGFVASRNVTSADSAETLVESAKDIAGNLDSPGAIAMLKNWKNQLNARGLQFYRNADQKTMVEVFQWAKRNGMSEMEAKDYAVEAVRASQPPSNGFDYTRSYLAFLPVRLMYPFMGAVSRVAALGSEMVNRWNQAETQAERAQAYRGLLYYGLGIAAASTIGGAWKQLVWARRTGNEAFNEKDHYLRDTALDAVSMGVSPPLGRTAQMLARAWDYGEDPSQVTTVRGVGDALHGFATLVKAAGSESGVDLDEPKQRKAALKVVEGAASAAHIQMRGVDQVYRLVVPDKEKQD